MVPTRLAQRLKAARSVLFSRLQDGVVVCIAAGCNHQSVAELTLGLILALARHIPQGDRHLRDGRWEPLGGRELFAKTLGIVGLGRVGKSVALLGRAFGMRVLATDVVLDHTFASVHGVDYVPLPQLLRTADVVSLHCPLTSDTRRLINERRLALMKPTAYLVNTARGPIVDEAALTRALRTGGIAGAALDVFEVEPVVDAELRALPSVILAPHVGGSTDEALERSIELALLNVTQVLDGAPPVCRVN